MKYDICVFGGCALDQMYYKNEKGEIPETPSLIVPGGKGVFINHKEITKPTEKSINESIIEICGSVHKKFEEKKSYILPGMFMMEELGIKKMIIDGVTIYTNTTDLEKILSPKKRSWWKK